MTSHDVQEYVRLIRSFLDGDITTSDFEQRYLQMFKADSTIRSQPEYEVLNSLFSDVDMFCADPTIRSADGLDEKQLPAQALRAFNALTALIRPQLSYDNVVGLLVEKVPELRPLLDAHIQQNDELLPHVFFGELTRYLMDQLSEKSRGSDQGSSDSVARILDFLGQAMNSSDKKVQELVSVSFLENLDPSHKDFPKLKSLLGPTLKREFDTYQRGQKPPSDMNRSAEADILELLNEDDYGSWELWWRVSQLRKGEDVAQLMNRFVASVDNLISRRIICAKRRSASSNQLKAVPFSVSELRRELEHVASPDPERFYWFGKANV